MTDAPVIGRAALRHVRWRRLPFCASRLHLPSLSFFPCFLFPPPSRIASSHAAAPRPAHRAAWRLCIATYHHRAESATPDVRQSPRLGLDRLGALLWASFAVDALLLTRPSEMHPPPSASESASTCISSSDALPFPPPRRLVSASLDHGTSDREARALVCSAALRRASPCSRPLDDGRSEAHREDVRKDA